MKKRIPTSTARGAKAAAVSRQLHAWLEMLGADAKVTKIYIGTRPCFWTCEVK